jgi:hypothetical protein
MFIQSMRYGLKLLPLQSQYILSLLLFVVDNKNKFKLNSDVYNMNTRQKCNFQVPSSNLSLYQKESTLLA